MWQTLLVPLTITHLSLFFLVSIQKLTPDDSIQAEELLGASCVWCVCVCVCVMCEYVWICVCVWEYYVSDCCLSDSPCLSVCCGKMVLWFTSSNHHRRIIRPLGANWSHWPITNVNWPPSPVDDTWHKRPTRSSHHPIHPPVCLSIRSLTTTLCSLSSPLSLAPSLSLSLYQNPRLYDGIIIAIESRDSMEERVRQRTKDIPIGFQTAGIKWER